MGVRLREALHGRRDKAGHDAEVVGRHGAAAVDAEGADGLLGAAGRHAPDDGLQLVPAQALLLVLRHLICLVLGPAQVHSSCQEPIGDAPGQLEGMWAPACVLCL